MKNYIKSILVACVFVGASVSYSKQSVLKALDAKRIEVQQKDNVFEHTFDRNQLGSWFDPIDEAQKHIDIHAHTSERLQKSLQQIITSFNAVASIIRQAYTRLFAPDAQFKRAVADDYTKKLETISKNMKQLDIKLRTSSFTDVGHADAQEVLRATAGYVKALSDKASKDLMHKLPR